MMRTILFIAMLLPGIMVAAKDVNIIDFGAISDGKTITSESIQKAIDFCAETGGGTVSVPPGSYLIYPVFLRDNVNLCIQKGARMLGTSAPGVATGGLINAIKVKNAAITGLGTIDGQGAVKRVEKSPAHYNILLSESKNITVKDVTLLNSATWNFRIRECDGVMIDGIRIFSFARGSNDGIDCDGKNITITGCIIDTDDDAICMKSDNPGYMVENISVSNCVLSSTCNAIKFGTSSYCGFRNVAISNCVIKKPSLGDIRKWSQVVKGVNTDTVGVSGISLEIVDGGIMEQVTISNISITGVMTPLFIRLGSRNGKGIMKNIIISNITATSESLITNSITGIPGSYVENVIIKNIILTCKGTGSMTEAGLEIPEYENKYPASRMFGYALPSYGMYVRHVKGLTMSDFIINLNFPDSRPAVMLDDCHDIRIDNFNCDLPQEGQPLFRFINSIGVTFSGYSPVGKVPLLMRLEGDKCSDIRLIGNDLKGIGKIADTREGAKLSSLRKIGDIE